jgi:HK97 family phage portal protein
MVFQLFQTNTQQPENTKSASTAPLFALHSSGRVAWSPRDVGSLVRNGFTSNPIGFRCVRMICEAAASVPLVLQDAERRYDVHPLLSLCANPNETQTTSGFLESLIGQLLLTGNGYVESAGENAVDGGPSFLYVLRSDRMRVVPGADGWPIAYEYVVGAKKHRFDLRQENPPVLHIKSFHPQDDHYGLSPLQAAASSIDVHNSASRWSKALLDNAARPSGAIVYKGTGDGSALANDQYSRLVDELESNHQGAANAGRPMLLEGGLDWKPMGFSPSDMEFHKTKETAAREIALSFGLPPMLLGIPGDNTYSNYQEANRAFYRLTVLPLVTKVAASLSGWLTKHYTQTLVLKPDLDNIPALASERDTQWKRVAGADFLTNTEKRALLGLPALTENE